MKNLTLCFLSVITLFAAKSLSAQNKHVVIAYVGGYRGQINNYPIAAEKVTHINYAFVNLKGGKAFLNNERVDTANLRNLSLLKQKNPSLKILISIGGWSWSGNFSDAVLTDSSRKIFAASAVEIIRKYQLDGVDIDWEYPGMSGKEGNIKRPEDQQNYTLMFKALRDELNILAKETGSKKLLTVAVGGFPYFLEHTEMGKAQQYLDYINLMTYDYFPQNIAGHHTNLYASKDYNTRDFADKAVEAFTGAGVPKNKLVMGIAFYGRRFSVSGDSSKKGLGDKSIKHLNLAGYTYIKDSLINKAGFTYYKDNNAKAPYLYNEQTKEFITFDDEWSVDNKCKYVRKKGMAGVMFWEYDSDLKEYLLDEIAKKLE